MEVQVQRFDDSLEVPVWSAMEGRVVSMAPGAIEGPELLCVVTNKIGRVRLVRVARTRVTIDDGRFRDDEGREIRAVLLREQDSSACIAALKPAEESFAQVGAAVGVQFALTKPSVSSAAVSRRTKLSQIERNWFNCGRTAVCLQEDFAAVGARLHTLDRYTYTAPSFEGFLSIFSKEYPKPVLLDCTIDGVHTFTLELQAMDKTYLVQGYQGAYSAFWWQGLAARPQDLSLPADASPEQVQTATNRLAATRQLRDVVGRGRAMDLDTLGTYVLVPLRDLFKAGTWNEQAQTAWRRCPFFPGETTPTNGENIQLVVTAVEILNAADVYATFDADWPASLCGLVVARALREYERLLEASD